MLPQWVVGLVVGFVVRQIKRYGESLDWVKLKAEAELVLRQSLPDWIEGAAVELAFNVIDVFAGVLGSSELTMIAEKLLLGDVGGALLLLKDVIVRLIQPVHPVLASQLVKACDEYCEV